MLFDELQELIKSIKADINTIHSFWKENNLAEAYNQLDNRTIQEDFCEDPDKIKILKALQHPKEQGADKNIISSFVIRRYDDHVLLIYIKIN
jgi:hypothetical protein